MRRRQVVYDRTHRTMPNGTGLKGHPSSTQSAMIIPKPDSTNEYYLFVVGSGVDNGEYGFNYYTIDMNADGGLGNIVAGPIDLTEGKADNWTEKVAAIKGDECNTFWVLSYVENEFYAYKVTNAGVADTPIISKVNYTSVDRRGYLKIAPNGEKIAIAHMRNYVNNIRSKGSFFLYDFDNSTGVVTNQRDLPLTSPADNPYGVEFSSNSEKLYVSASNDFWSTISSEYNNPVNHFSTLYQFNLPLLTQYVADGAEVRYNHLVALYL